jgi:hypothetical protein
MGKSSGSMTTTNGLDPLTQQWRQQLFNSAQAAGNTPGQGVDPLVGQAGQYFQNASRAGMMGMNALNGDQNAIQGMMNPYQGQVMDQYKAAHGDALAMTQRNVNDQMTKTGAFGGSRHGIAMGQALSGANRNFDQQSAQLLQGGYNDAMNRAGQMANMGFGAAHGMSGIGQINRNVAQENDPNYRRMMMMRQGLDGTPYGTTQTTPMQRNGASGFLGGAATGAQIGSAIPGLGTAFGAGIGGLLGLFG